MSSKEHPIIIFLDRNGFIIYQDTLSNIWQFPFPQNLVQNLDVINKVQLVNSIGSFIQTNKVIPSSLIIILADSVIFQKDLAYLRQPSQKLQQPDQQQDSRLIIGEKEDHEKEIRNFLDNVPFEEVIAKVINNTRLVAANKDLLEAVIHPFKKIGCSVDVIIPAFMYQQYIDFSGGLSQDIARIVLQQTDLLKLGNMLTSQQKVETQQDSKGEPQKTKEKPKNLRQLILIVAFVVLLIILVIVYLTLGRTPQTPPSPRAPSPTPVLSEPTKTLEPTVSPMPIDLQTIKITIIGNKETEVLANALKNLLTESGFKDITTKDSTNPIPARSSALFSKSIPESARQKAIAEIKKIFPDVLVQEGQELESVITIILGKSA